VCGNNNLPTVFDLGMHPLPDDLVKIGDDRVCAEYPLEVLFCDRCKTAHQKYQLPREQLFFPEYHYRGGQTQDVLSGMEQLVDSVEEHFSVRGARVLDVGCNDGSLLDAFRRRGVITSGIEPTDAAKEAQEKGHAVMHTFFDCQSAVDYLRHHLPPDVITFTNVFAHIEDLEELLAALRIIKAPYTRIVVENHYLGSVLDRHQFDTFYHEHLRTYSFTSFLHIALKLDMRVSTVEFPARYGGNIRVFMEPGEAVHVSGEERVLAREEKFGDRLQHLNTQVAHWASKKRSKLIGYIMADYPAVTPLSAVAFPTRASILIRLLYLNEEHIAAVYEKEGSKKIGYYVPGTRIPILSDSGGDLGISRMAGPLLNLAWHIPEEIDKRWRGTLDYHGEFIQVIAEEDFK
jgi:SAM-dependent methyltransferase